MAPVDDRASRTVDRPSPPAADEPPGADPLSDALRNVRLTGALFFVWEASFPFATSVPDGSRFAHLLLPRARQIVSYHVVVEGSCWGGLVGGEPVHLRPGDVLLVPRGDAYVMAGSAAACRRTPIDEAAAREFFAAMAAGDLPPVVREGDGGAEVVRVVCGFLGCDVRPFNPVVAALPPLLRLAPSGGPSDERLRRLVDYALAEAGEPAPGSGGILARLGELMFVEVLRRCLRQPDEAPRAWLAGLEDPVVGRCLALMHRRPAADWTLARLATAVGASRSALAERFADRVGMPPIEYLTRWRLQMAANLLEDTSAKVATVADRVGYGSAAALTRAFKRVVGVTPGEWREGGGEAPAGRVVTPGTSPG
ncbi:MAG TPA: AraC family transcriptional regulator [Thermoanaerobaculia bacterium]